MVTHISIQILLTENYSPFWGGAWRMLARLRGNGEGVQRGDVFACMNYEL